VRADIGGYAQCRSSAFKRKGLRVTFNTGFERGDFALNVNKLIAGSLKPDVTASGIKRLNIYLMLTAKRNRR
jgi:hypothetical protein